MDEATVMMEGIHAAMAEGVPKARAVVLTASRTAGPRLLAMLAILGVFLPSFFMTGVARQLFVPLSLAVAFAMAFSYLLSGTVVPVLSVLLIRHARAGGGSLYGRLQGAYAWYAGQMLRFRWPLTALYLATVAVAADVGRRTAYRYFLTQEQLLAEASLESLRPRVEAIIAAARRELDAPAALERTVGEIQRLAVEHEALLRTILRLSLDQRFGEGFPGRGRRRLDWIGSALGSVKPQLPKRVYERLVSALTLVLGVEALVILHDTRGLDSKQSIGICQWAARAMLEAAMREGGQKPPG